MTLIIHTAAGCYGIRYTRHALARLSPSSIAPDAWTDDRLPAVLDYGTPEEQGYEDMWDV